MSDRLAQIETYEESELCNCGNCGADLRGVRKHIREQKARIQALEVQAALDSLVRAAAMALISRGEPIVARDDVEVECGVCHGTRWGPCEDIPVAQVLNDTVQHTDDCEWVALEAALAAGEKEA